MAEKYSKGEIIRIIDSGLVSDPEDMVDIRTLGNRLNDIIKFLTSPRAKLVMDWEDDTKGGDYFLNREMNILHEKRENESFKYNAATAIILMLLLQSYKSEYFQLLINNKYAPEKEGRKWFLKIEQEIEGLKEHYVPGDQGVGWKAIKFNIENQLYKLTMPDINKKILENMNADLQSTIDKFLALENDDKVIAYDLMQNRLTYINNQLDDLVDDMDPASKQLFKMNIKSKEENHKEMIDLIVTNNNFKK